MAIKDNLMLQWEGDINTTIQKVGETSQQTHDRRHRKEEIKEGEALISEEDQETNSLSLAMNLGPSMKAFDSRTKILKQVMEALRDENMHTIAICGMGGIGKTTMAKEVVRRAKVEKLFDGVVMAVVSQQPNVIKIQGEIADFLGFKLNAETESGRASELLRKIKKSGKILIILDDVWKRLDLEVVGIPYGSQHSGCRILLTSRNEEVACSLMRSQRTFTIGVLSEDEAWNLFQEAAGTSINSHDLHPIAQEIAKECKGLPVAIITVGRALENRGKLEWEDALGQLRKSTANNISSEVDEYVYSSLELSFTFLGSEEAKSCFLLCCLFPEDDDIPIETLVRHGKRLGLFQDTDTVEDARRRVHSLVQNLKRCFLLLESDKEECVKMHDVVRDVAKSITSRKEHGFVVINEGESLISEEDQETNSLSLAMNLRPSMKAFDSRTKILKQVMEALRDENMHTIAICGMGGIGKTTMAKEVARRAKEEKLFDGVVMAVVSQHPNVIKIQGEIADFLGFKLNAETESGRASELLRKIKKGGKILIILDDVWRRLDLEVVGIPSGSQHSGCRILLTSRNEEVARSLMRSQRTFTIGVLSEDEAWNLFQEAAGTSINSHDLHPIAKEIAKECKGLPVAIITVGRALENRGKLEWEDALGQLRKSTANNISSEVDEYVYSSLELSFTFLGSEEAKSCFLLCCLFPEDHDIPIETLVRYGKGLGLFQDTDTVEDARRRVHSLVQNLKRCFLLLESDKEECVKMHDVIRDVAISIASRKEHGFVVRCENETEEWPEIERREVCTTISLVTNKIKKSLDCMRCPNLKLLHLSVNLIYDGQELNENFCQEMKQLKVLALQRMSIQSLPSSLEALQNLQTLLLENCYLRDISSVGALVKLEVLSLCGSEIQELPEEIRNLQRLKLLDIAGCKYLKQIPPGVLRSLNRLEELYIGASFTEWSPSPAQGNQDAKTSASLDEIVALSDHLKVLVVQIPPQVYLLQRNFVFNNLRRFWIAITNVPILWQPTYLFGNELFLDEGTDDALIKSGFCPALSKCEALALGGLIGNFTKLHEVGFSRRLKNFTLTGVEGVEYLMDLSSNWGTTSGPFPVLETLELAGVWDLRGICHPDLLQARQREINNFNPPPPPAEGILFRNLKQLRIRNCHEMTYVFSTYLARGSLPQLQTLDLQRCNEMEGIVYKEAWENDNDIADDMVVFPALTTLTLTSLQCLISLYLRNDNTNTTPQAALVDKDVQESSSQSAFTLVPSKCIKWLPSLEKLDLSSCFSPRVVFDFGGLIMPLPSEEKKNSELVAAAHEEEEKEVDDHLDGTDQRRHCFLKCLPAPPSARSLKGRSKTSTTTSWRCNAPTDQVMRSATTDDGLQQQQLLRNLKYVQVSQCDSVVVIFDFGESQGLFPPVLNNLSEMILINLRKLTHIWNIKKGPQQLVFGFQNLRMLRVEYCDGLTNIFYPSIAKLLVMLEEIEIKKCKFMQVVVAKEEEMNVKEDVILSFPHLRSISLERLAHLSCFCDQPNCGFLFPSLETIQISGCPELQTFVEPAAAGGSAEDVVAPKLKQVEDSDLPPPHSNNWQGNLNATIQNNFRLKAERQASREK